MHQSPEVHLPFSEVRPRFQIQTEKSMDAIAADIRSALARPGATCRGQVNTGFISLYIPVEEQHYWSPRLTITLEEADGGVLLRGLYGPRPAVWTMFVFFYTLLGFGIMVVGIVGSANRSLGLPSGILWWIPVMAVLILSLYLVAYAGKKMGYDQMVTLHHFLEDATGLRM
jgi:hypothetical protein